MRVNKFSLENCLWNDKFLILIVTTEESSGIRRGRGSWEWYGWSASSSWPTASWRRWLNNAHRNILLNTALTSCVYFTVVFLSPKLWPIKCLVIPNCVTSHDHVRMRVHHASACANGITSLKQATPPPRRLLQANSCTRHGETRCSSARVVLSSTDGIGK